MSTNVTLNGSSYTIPAIADASWGNNVSNYLIAIATATFQKSGGAFTLTADADFGATFGLKAAYFESRVANPAVAGLFRLAKTDTASWRNNANGADLALGINGSDALIFNSIVIADISSSQTLTNKLLSDSTVKFANVSDPTKLLLFSLGGATSGKTMTIVSSHTNNRSLTLPDTTDTLMALALAQSPTNKTFDNTNQVTLKDNKFTLQANGDVTKQAVFVLSPLTAGHTTTMNVPEVNGTDTLQLLALAQSPTNKTFDNTNQATLKDNKFTLQATGDVTKQAVFLLSSITAGHTSTLSVPEINGTDTLVMLALQQTATNKLLSDSTVKFANVSDATKTLLFSLGGATAGQAMTLISSHTTARSITFPDATDTLMGKATTDTMTNKTATAMAITGGSFVNYLVQAASRYNDSSTNYVAMKAPSSVTTYTITLPGAVPTANQVLADAGAGDGVMAWVSAASSSLNQYNQDIGNSSNSRTGTNTNLLGDILAQTRSQTATVTIASPGVFTSNGHGMANGDKFYLTTTGALPTGLSASTTYYASNVATNTFNASTTLANAVAGTYINTSGSQSGTHTLFMGGLTLTSGTKATVTNDSATAGYVGEMKGPITRVYSNILSLSNNTTANICTTTSITLTPGDWQVQAIVGFETTGLVASFDFAISATSATLPATDTLSVPTSGECWGFNYDQPISGTGDTYLNIPPYRVSVAAGATKQLYLVGRIVFSTGTGKGWGSMEARRMR